MSWMGKRSWTGRRASIPQGERRRIAAELGGAMSRPEPDVERDIAEIESWPETPMRKPYDNQPHLDRLLARMKRDKLDPATHDVRPIANPRHNAIISGVFAGPKLMWAYRGRRDGRVESALNYPSDLDGFREATVDDGIGDTITGVFWAAASPPPAPAEKFVDSRAAERLRRSYREAKPIVDGILEIADTQDLQRMKRAEESFRRVVFDMDPSGDVREYVDFSLTYVGPQSFSRHDLDNVLGELHEKQAALPKPSVPQLDALRHMLSGGNLIRLPGGFWTTRDTPIVEQGIEKWPAWNTSVHTVNAMDKRGWIERAGIHAEAWKDERKLTEIGRKIATG